MSDNDMFADLEALNCPRCEVEGSTLRVTAGDLAGGAHASSYGCEACGPSIRGVFKRHGWLHDEIKFVPLPKRAGATR